MGQISIKISGLSKRFGTLFAIRNLSFTVRPGEILGFLGANGAGKSTTMKIMAGVMKPSSGQVLWRGESIFSARDEYLKQLGYMPENCELYGYLSAFEYIEMVAGLRLVQGQNLAERICGLLEVFGLQKEIHIPLSGFSKGMRQKVLLISALIHNPQVLLLDEPLSGLDPDSTLLVRRLITELAAAGRTVIFSCHVLEVVEKICTRVLIIKQGQQVLDESIDQIDLLIKNQSLENCFRELTSTPDQRNLAGEALALIEA